MNMHALCNPIQGRRCRNSSYDRSGGNSDYLTIAPGETKILLDHDGNGGNIYRIWLTINSIDSDYLKKIFFSMIFDGEETVSKVPVGMFFATGPWGVNDLVSEPISVMRSRVMNSDQGDVGSGSFNTTWSMPFSRQALIKIHSESNFPFLFFYYVDYIVDVPVKSISSYLFHAAYNCNIYTTPQEVTNHASQGSLDLLTSEVKNLSNKNNYIFADINGFSGNYVGTTMAVESKPDRMGKWYEGDDMFVVDNESWPPRLHGTGTEDYFGMAWGVHRKYQGWDHGVTHYERNITDHDRFFDGRFLLYRWHLVDPISFTKSLHASIEAGHANECAQHYESVAYWYGSKCHL